MKDCISSLFPRDAIILQGHLPFLRAADGKVHWIYSDCSALFVNIVTTRVFGFFSPIRLGFQALGGGRDIVHD